MIFLNRKSIKCVDSRKQKKEEWKDDVLPYCSNQSSADSIVLKQTCDINNVKGDLYREHYKY